MYERGATGRQTTRPPSSNDPVQRGALGGDGGPVDSTGGDGVVRRRSRLPSGPSLDRNLATTTVTDHTCAVCCEPAIRQDPETDEWLCEKHSKERFTERHG